jgi:septal ring factor EnvC (AmiA/AmiB activator)
MRKLILISAFVLASASTQASDIGSLIPAANDTAAEATPTAADAARPAASRQRAPSRSKKTQAQPRETPEQKARQIAAQYGISW